MKKYVILIALLFCISLGYAQGASVVETGAAVASGGALSGGSKSFQTVEQMMNSVFDGINADALKESAISNALNAEINRVQRVSAVEETTQTSPYPSGLSEAAYFHRLGNGEFWQPPVTAELAKYPLPRGKKERSFDALILEASALGILPQNWETYHPAELENFISMYKALKASEKIPSRTEHLKGATEFELAKWVYAQPDFVKENYVHKYYTEPFHPDVKNLRVIIANDDYSYVDPLLEAARTMPGVEIQWVCGLQELKKLLKQNPSGYDIILSDYWMDNGVAVEVGMYMWKKHPSIPVIFYTCTPANATWLFRYNIRGRIGLANTPAAAQRVLNYLSNIVATGRAYPNENSTLAQLQQWASQQPGFYSDNYKVAKNYDQPFHPSVYSMRILAVQKDGVMLEPLAKALARKSGVELAEINGTMGTLVKNFVYPIDAPFQLDIVADEQGAWERLWEVSNEYDLVLISEYSEDGNISQLGNWMHERKIDIPVVAVSPKTDKPIPDGLLFKNHIVGKIPFVSSAQEADYIVNCLSNILWTGKAYPNR